MSPNKSMVKPQSEYCVQFWSPQLKKDIDALEKDHKRGTKMIMGLEHHTSSTRKS